VEFSLGEKRKQQIKNKDMKNYKFKALKSVTLNNAQRKLTEHYNKVGIYEEFGQEVVRHLKDSLGYNPYSHEDKDKKVFNRINELDKWCYNFSG
jgi:hypothetical protein